MRREERRREEKRKTWINAALVFLALRTLPARRARRPRGVAFLLLFFPLAHLEPRSASPSCEAARIIDVTQRRVPRNGSLAKGCGICQRKISLLIQITYPASPSLPNSASSRTSTSNLISSSSPVYRLSSTPLLRTTPPWCHWCGACSQTTMMMKPALACVTDPQAEFALRASRWLTQPEFKEELLRLFVKPHDAKATATWVSIAADLSGLLTPVAPLPAACTSGGLGAHHATASARDRECLAAQSP